MVKYEIDPAHTNIGFSAKHLAVATVHGRFNKFEGQFEGPDDDVTKAHGEVKIDVASLSTHTEQRDQHLLSPDFFDAAKHPYMTYRVTGVQPPKVRRTGSWATSRSETSPSQSALSRRWKAAARIHSAAPRSASASPSRDRSTGSTSV